ncbi:redoxin domain-containing protein [Pseudoflavitalea rhizosphaerae]|uniref:redoxin domain-containing protein n=1 Tax=Pseudoflavitalea rhizosphaerae TaxID=1884793 RepID=UPI001F4996F1|nr:redoxin domain-containing protein [Pseudoflavitalea rhizosphaerae]
MKIVVVGGTGLLGSKLVPPSITQSTIVTQKNNSMLPRGTTAPDFELYSTPDQKLKLSDLKNKKVILAFYPADWSPVCDDQMNLYNEMGKFFSRHNAQVLGISVDSKWSHLAFADHNKFHFPLLSDFEPKGEVARLYEVYNEKTGECQRALYVLDEAGLIQWSYLSPVGINPGADGILNALEELDNVKIINQ